MIFFLLLLLPIPLFFRYIKKHVFSKNPPLPPGPFSWPIIGNIHQMGRELHSILANLARVHGPLICKRILKTHDKILSGRPLSHATPVINPTLNNFSIGFANECNDHWREKKVMELVGFLGSKEGEVVNLGEVVYITVTNILSNELFSIDFLDFEGQGIGKELRKLLTEDAELGITVNLSDLYPILSGLDFQGIRKKTGIDTSIIAIEWGVANLMKNQDAMHKLRDELDREIGTDIVKESHLAHLPYLQACVNETLRLHPPGPLLLPHRALQTCQVMGYTVPKDSQVLVNMWAIGRDSMIWNDSLSFKLERFLDSSLDSKGNNFEYIPFSAGRRIFPGQSLATMQVPYILASLVHSFDWFLPGNMNSTELDMNEKFTITLRKKQPLQLIPKGRK
ncbi:hypothetical protein ACB094_12G063600 [Castanea mollissima]